MDKVVYLRDLDGTGSLHPCAKGDRGAVAFVPAPECPCCNDYGQIIAFGVIEECPSCGDPA